MYGYRPGPPYLDIIILRLSYRYTGRESARGSGGEFYEFLFLRDDLRPRRVRATARPIDDRRSLRAVAL